MFIINERRKNSLEEFKTNFSVFVSRYEVYPKEQPTCYCVGLIVKENSGKGERYIDTQVPLSDTIDKSESEIVKLGFENMLNAILSWETTVDCFSRKKENNLKISYF